MLPVNLAIGTWRDAVLMPLFHQPAQTGIICRELAVEVVDCKATFGGNGLRNFHGKYSVPQILPYVKGYLPLLRIDSKGLSMAHANDLVLCSQ